MGSFTLRSLSLRETKPRYQLDMRLGGPKVLFGRFGEDKNLLSLLESNRGSPISLRSCYPDFVNPALLYFFIYIY
jgi:hypothetical protein